MVNENVAETSLSTAQGVWIDWVDAGDWYEDSDDIDFDVDCVIGGVVVHMN